MDVGAATVQQQSMAMAGGQKSSRASEGTHRAVRRVRDVGRLRGSQGSAPYWPGRLDSEPSQRVGPFCGSKAARGGGLWTKCPAYMGVRQKEKKKRGGGGGTGEITHRIHCQLTGRQCS